MKVSVGAPSKRARKVRSASEFDVARLKHAVAPPTEGGAAYSWTLADIVAARDAQMRGQFRLPARLAESMRTDDALMVAFQNRLAPQRSLPVEIVAAKGARGESIAREAEALFGQGGVGISPKTILDIAGSLVNHGVAFGVNVVTPRSDGTRVDFALQPWPIEHVRWDSYDRCFKARVDTYDAPGIVSVGGEVPIVHGDGRWVVFQHNEIDPFKHGALLAAALIWARRAFALRDWAKGSVSHGNAKVVGEMPTGVPLQGADGAISSEAAAFLELLRAIASSDCPVGIRPAGSKTDLITNTSTAWNVWSELVLNSDTSAARVYLGTDGTLGANGGAPGVDISALFGVATTLVQGDCSALDVGISTGTVAPWSAVNFGTSDQAPSRRYLLPDADADAYRKSIGERRAAFFADIEASKRNGFAITQEYVNDVAKAYDIAPPTLATAPGAASPSSDAPGPPALRRV